jgi:hypothetical protein
MLSDDTVPCPDSRVPAAGPRHREGDDWVGASAVRCFAVFIGPWAPCTSLWALLWIH